MQDEEEVQAAKDRIRQYQEEALVRVQSFAKTHQPRVIEIRVSDAAIIVYRAAKTYIFIRLAAAAIAGAIDEGINIIKGGLDYLVDS